MEDWIIGSKDLTRYFDRPDWKNCKRYLKRNGIVLLRWPNGQPAIHKPSLVDFILTFNEKISISTPQ